MLRQVGSDEPEDGDQHGSRSRTQAHAGLRLVSRPPNYDRGDGKNCD